MELGAADISALSPIYRFHEISVAHHKHLSCEVVLFSTMPSIYRIQRMIGIG